MGVLSAFFLMHVCMSVHVHVLCVSVCIRTCSCMCVACVSELKDLYICIIIYVIMSYDIAMLTKYVFQYSDMACPRLL